MRRFSQLAAGLLCLPATLLAWTPARAEDSKPNILIVTVDDMSADSLGAFGCELKDTSPQIDAFAKTAMKFNHAHCLVGNCMPGRNIMWSGLYSHVNGVEGFQQNKTPDYPVLCDLAKQAGYFAGIRGKVSHSTPYTPYAWDGVMDSDADGSKRHTKDIGSYGASTAEGIRAAKEADKPFCLMINISDPHKPFYSGPKDKHQPSRVFTADEVPVPGFLPGDGVIRKELALYYSSVRRADDCFGSIMTALNESGQADNTFVMFLSDHGMPLPFAKTQLYQHSTHTPLMVRWPKVTQAGSEDNHHMVSAVDFVPTLLDVMQHQHPKPEILQGRSFASILRGEMQDARDFVVLQYNENSGRNRHPMRGIQTREMLYLYNPWSNGERKFATATTGTATYKQMVKRAPNESDVAARLDLFDHRVVNELYDIKNDPDCLINLADSPKHAKTLNDLRKQLIESLTSLKDPVAPVLAAHNDASVRIAFMEAEDERSRQHKAKRKQGKKNKPKNKRNKNQKLISIQPPLSYTKSTKTTVTIHHKLPKHLGKQQLTVTLKKASGNRIDRQTVSIEGTGDATVTFDATDSDAIRFSAFVGEDYGSSLHHVTSDPLESNAK